MSTEWICVLCNYNNINNSYKCCNQCFTMRDSIKLLWVCPLCLANNNKRLTKCSLCWFCRFKHSSLNKIKSDNVMKNQLVNNDLINNNNINTQVNIFDKDNWFDYSNIVNYDYLLIQHKYGNQQNDIMKEDEILDESIYTSDQPVNNKDNIITNDWTCSICKYDNNKSSKVCDMCCSFHYNNGRSWQCPRCLNKMTNIVVACSLCPFINDTLKEIKRIENLNSRYSIVTKSTFSYDDSIDDSISPIKRQEVFYVNDIRHSNSYDSLDSNTKAKLTKRKVDSNDVNNDSNKLIKVNDDITKDTSIDSFNSFTENDTSIDEQDKYERLIKLQQQVFESQLYLLHLYANCLPKSK